MFRERQFGGGSALYIAGKVRNSTGPNGELDFPVGSFELIISSRRMGR